MSTLFNNEGIFDLFDSKAINEAVDGQFSRAEVATIKGQYDELAKRKDVKKVVKYDNKNIDAKIQFTDGVDLSVSVSPTKDGNAKIKFNLYGGTTRVSTWDKTISKADLSKLAKIIMNEL